MYLGKFKQNVFREIFEVTVNVNRNIIFANFCHSEVESTKHKALMSDLRDTQNSIIDSLKSIGR